MNSFIFDYKLSKSRIKWDPPFINFGVIEDNAKKGYLFITCPIILLYLLGFSEYKNSIIDYIDYYNIYILSLIYIRDNWEDYFFSELESSGSVLYHNLEDTNNKLIGFLNNHEKYLELLEIKIYFINLLLT